MAAEQQVLRFPLLFGLELLQEAHFAAGERRYRDAVAIEEAIAAQRRESCAGCQDADAG